MRKLLLLALLLATVPSWAGDINVLSGDLSVVKNPEITATVIFDYSDLMIEGKPWKEHLESRGEDFVRDWPAESAQSEGYFIACWNKDNKKGMQTTLSKGNEYTMVFDVNEMDMGSGAASFFIGFGAGGAKMSGTMYLFQGTNSVPVLTVEIDGQTGRSGMTEIARRLDLYGELAEDMVKAMKKTKASNVDPSNEEAPADILKLIGASASTATAAAPAKPAATKAKTEQKAVKKAAKATPKVEEKPATTTKQEAAPVVENSEEIKLLLAAHGAEVHRRKDAVQGDFSDIARQRRIGIYMDFSEAQIMGRSESAFIRYMKTSAGKRDLDPDFDSNWQDIKLSLQDLFMSEVNNVLSDEDLNLRFVDKLDGMKYALKMEVLETDDNGNNKVNYLFVDMSTGNVVAQITCESDGGRVGRYTGLLEQGFESGAEDFCDELLDQID